MATIALSALRLKVREQADMVNSTFVSDSELTSYINLSASRLHDILISKHGADYFISSDISTTINGQEDYALPSDFYKVRGVDIEFSNGEPFAIRAFNFAERHYNKWPGPRVPYEFRYRVLGNNLRLSPVPTAGNTLTIWYHPEYTPMVADGDTMPGFNGYERWVIIDAAIKCLIKEESDTTQLMNERAFIERQIEEAADNRDAGEPATISDVEPRHQRRSHLWP